MSNLVTFEQAKQLNDLGYTERSEYAYLLHQKSGNHRLYSPFGRIDYNQNNNRDNSNKIAIHYSAPTVSEALDWIREKFNLMCGVYPTMRPSTTIDNPKWAAYKWSIMKYERDTETGMNEVEYIELNEWFDTHPLANSALLSAVLEYLIEKEK